MEDMSKNLKPIEPREMNIPDWVKPDAMLELGYELIHSEHSPNDKGYFKYGNVAGHTFAGYGVSGKHKRIIYFNCEMSRYYGGKPYLGIKEDADTRTVYGGVCPDREFLVALLYNVR